MIADKISSIFGLLHSDLHEERATAALEYMSSMVGSVEPDHHSSENSLLEKNFTQGKFSVRSKRRNGRVRVTVISLFLNVNIFGITNLKNWCTDVISLVFRVKSLKLKPKESALLLFQQKMKLPLQAYCQRSVSCEVMSLSLKAKAQVLKGLLLDIYY
jgi:hypothetical protein